MFSDGMNDSLHIHLILIMTYCPIYRDMIEVARVFDLNEKAIEARKEKGRKRAYSTPTYSRATSMHGDGN